MPTISYRLKMMTLFKSYDLWDLVKSRYDKPDEWTRPKVTQWQQFKKKMKKDAKALFLIPQALVDVILLRVMEKTQ